MSWERKNDSLIVSMCMKGLISACNRIPLSIWLFFISCLYYLLISQNLFVCDDFGYALSIDGSPLKGGKDIIDAQVQHYFTTNGRFLVHCVVMLFAGILGMTSFRICSTFLFAILVYEMYILCGKKYRSVIPISILAMMVLLPAFNITIIGNIATVTNYLWVAVFFFAYIIGLQRMLYGTSSKYAVICWSIFAFVSGALQESFSIGCAASSLLLLYLHRKTISREAVSMIICYCLGAALLILAPANFLRATNANDGSIINKITNAVRVFSDGWAFLGFIIFIVVSWWKDKLHTRDFLKKNILLLCTFIVSILFACVVAYIGPHQMTAAFLSLIVLTIRWIIEFFPLYVDKFRHIASFISVLVIAMMFPYIYSYRCDVRSAYDKMCVSAKESTDGVFYSQEYDSLSYHRMNWLQKQFTTTELVQDFPLATVSKYYSKGQNPDFLTSRLPYSKERIIRMCSSENQTSDNIYHAEGTTIYILRTPRYPDFEYKSVCIGQKNSMFGYLRNLIFHRENPELFITISSIADLPSFSDSDYSYYILNYKEEYPVISIYLAS